MSKDQEFPEGFVIKSRTEGRQLIGKYRGHDVVLFREKLDEDWYITVFNDQGFGYDGWWPESSDATFEQAVKEAIDGAQLDINPERTENK